MTDGARPKTVLIVDDDDGMRVTLGALLGDRYRCFTAESAEQAIGTLESVHIDLVVADVRLPGMGGIELVRRAKADNPDLEILVISILSDVEIAVQAIQAGAFHYCLKNFQYDSLHTLLERASEKQDLRRLTAALQDRIGGLPPPALVGGTAPVMQRLIAATHRIAAMEAPVLITGETGTGKALLARYIHAQSPSAAGPFVEASITAVPAESLEATLFGYEPGAVPGATRRQPGKFELASGGTLFVEEVADIPLPLQGRLRRVIQERQTERLGSRIPAATNFRLISATNRDLAQVVARGDFREDLYYQLRGIQIRVPPLRERPEDIPALATHFLADVRRRHATAVQTITPDAMAALQRHDWPGNVRELAFLIEHLVAIHDDADEPAITLRHLPIDLQLPHLRDDQTSSVPSSSLADAVAELEYRLITKALAQSNGNLAAAARELGMPHSTLRFKVRRYGLRADGAPPGSGEAQD